MTPTEMHIDALMEKIEKLEAENKKLTLDLSDANKLTRYAGDLIYLIENNLTVVAGINSFWVADIEGTSRVGQKCITVSEAIDTFRSNNP